MKRDVHGIINLLLGIALLLVTGVYLQEAPMWLLVISGVSGALLVIRDSVLTANKQTWAITDRG